MKKLLSIFFILFFCFPSYGEWTFINEIEGNKYHLDFKNIKTDDKFVYWYLLSNLGKPRFMIHEESMDQISIKSHILHYRGDCVEMKTEVLNQKFYEKPMGEKLFDSYERGGKWEYTVPDTFGFNLLKMVCILGGKSDK